MSSKYLADGVRPREIWAWAMFDFANSGYTTVVITAFFNAYFVAVVAEGKDWGTLAWSGALSLSYVLVMLTAPALGAYADAYASKKRVLLASTIGCVLFTAGLALVGRGDLYVAIPLVILSNFFFGVGENLIAAFLPELAKGEAMGRVSGWGWSIGLDDANHALERRDAAAAAFAIERLAAEQPEHPALKALRARLAFVETATAEPDVAALRARLGRDPADAAARHALAAHYALASDYATALSEWLEVMRLDRKFGDDLARRTLLMAFDVLGEGHELVLATRRRMAALLH